MIILDKLSPGDLGTKSNKPQRTQHICIIYLHAGIMPCPQANSGKSKNFRRLLMKNFFGELSL
jgi:hypothetical protein